MMRRNWKEVVVLIGAVGACASASWAQGLAKPVAKKPQPPADKGEAQPAPKPAPPQEDQPPAEKPKPAPMPSLDELLGTGGAKPGDAADTSQRDLDRLLSGAEVGDAFKQAAALMGDAAERLQQAHDAGLITQRVQDDVLKRLDQLISSLENMQRQSSSTSSSSTQQNRTNQNVPNQPARGQRQEVKGENRGETEPPARQDGTLRPGLEAARASWGRLPDRIRDLLVQGSGEPYSQLYKALTDAYYQKLAEQGKSKP